jgi:hypothetical protein
VKKRRTCLSKITSEWEKRWQKSELDDGESVCCEEEIVHWIQAGENCWREVVEEKRARRVETNDNRTVGQGVDFEKNASNSGFWDSEPQYVGTPAYNTG